MVQWADVWPLSTLNDVLRLARIDRRLISLGVHGRVTRIIFPQMLSTLILAHSHHLLHAAAHRYRVVMAVERNAVGHQVRFDVDVELHFAEVSQHNAFIGIVDALLVSELFAQ